MSADRERTTTTRRLFSQHNYYRTSNNLSNTTHFQRVYTVCVIPCLYLRRVRVERHVNRIDPFGRVRRWAIIILIVRSAALKCNLDSQSVFRHVVARVRRQKL